MHKKSKITDVLVILNNPVFKWLQTYKYSKFNTVLKQSSTAFGSCTELGVRHHLMHSYKTSEIHNISSSRARMSEWIFFIRNSMQGVFVCRLSLLYLLSYPNLIKTDFGCISVFIRLLDTLRCSWAENELSLLRSLPELDFSEPGASLSPAKSAVPFCCFLLCETNIKEVQTLQLTWMSGITVEAKELYVMFFELCSE